LRFSTGAACGPGRRSRRQWGCSGCAARRARRTTCWSASPLVLQRLANLAPELRRVPMPVDVHPMEHGGTDHLVFLTGAREGALLFARELPAIDHLPSHDCTSAQAFLP